LAALRGTKVDILCHDLKADCSHVIGSVILNYGRTQGNKARRMIVLDIEKNGAVGLVQDIFHADLT